MYTTWKLTIASLKMFVRNRQALFFTFFTPLLIMVIFGAIGFNNTPKINVGIALQGSLSESSQQFLTGLQSVPAFKLSYGTVAAEKAALEKGDRSIVIDLTTNPFDAMMRAEHTPGTLSVYSNAGDSSAPTALSIITQMIDTSSLQISGTQEIVNLDVTEVNSHNLKYIDFLLPGLVALSIMQLGVFSVAFVFVDFKEKGILKRVLATPVRPFQFVTANIITRLIMSLIQAAVFILVGVLFFKVTIIGSYWLIALVVIFGSIMFLSLGFTISGISKTTESVPAIANLVVFPMLFLGGTFFAVDSLPKWLQYIANILPLTYFSDALRQIMNNGAGIWDIKYDLAWIAGWAIVLVFLAVVTFRFEDSR